AGIHMTILSKKPIQEPPATTPTVEIQERQVVVEDDRTGMDDASLRRAFMDHLSYSVGKSTNNSTELDQFFAMALSVRDRLVYRWAQTQETYSKVDAKRIYYLSAEFLLGRALTNNLHALGLYNRAKDLLGSAGLELSNLLESEPEPGLGNGGL